MATTKLNQWKSARKHPDITLPSGTVVTLEIPNLGKMIDGNELPNGLLDAAVKFLNAKKVTSDLLKEQWQFTRYIVAKATVDPVVTEDDVAELPPEDTEMIAAIAMRERDLDAVGHQIGGLETDERWRRFRGFGDSDSNVAGL